MTGEKLLRAILERPEDDTPRLVYADWLVDNGQPERGEFVRVQLELAKLGPPHVVMTEPCHPDRRYGPDYFTLTGGEDAGGSKLIMQVEVGSRVDILHPIGIRSNKRLKPMHGLRVQKITDDEVILARDAKSGPWPGEELRRREQYLWPISTQFDIDTMTNWPLDVTRGFVSGIVCTSDAFLGERCATCGGTGIGASAECAAYVEIAGGCPRCPGSGWIEGNAKKLFNAHPITNVRLSDFRPIVMPCDAGQVYNWMSGRFRELESPWFVGPSLYPLIDLPTVKIGGVDFDGAKYAMTEDAAQDALSKAACRFGRQLAGLSNV